MTSARASEQQPRGLRFEDAAIYLGLNHRQLRRLRKHALGPKADRPGGKLLIFMTDDLDTWMASRDGAMCYAWLGVDPPASVTGNGAGTRARGRKR